jgi:UDP-N-acetylmuramate dehydrogenase
MFKNPGVNEMGSPINATSKTAGALLDEAGCKGLNVGAAQVWENHANFIINTGGATSTDVLKLMLMMYNRVNEKFGIELQPEIEYLGSDEKEIEIWQTLTN